MAVNKKATVPDSSIGVDVEQPLTKKYNEIIANFSTQNNLQVTENSSTGQISRCMVTKSPVNSGQAGLETISMDELYDAVYPPKIPIVDGLIYNGTYLFVGAPKVRKSFFMAQLGYHISKGIPLWNYPVHY